MDRDLHQTCFPLYLAAWIILILLICCIVPWGWIHCYLLRNMIITYISRRDDSIVITPALYLPDRHDIDIDNLVVLVRKKWIVVFHRTASCLLNSCSCFMRMLCSVCLFLFLDIYLFSLFFFFGLVSLLHSHCTQQILESVNYCHINGMVHRDFKVSMWPGKRLKGACSTLPCSSTASTVEQLTFSVNATSSLTSPHRQQSRHTAQLDSVLKFPYGRALLAGQVVAGVIYGGESVCQGKKCM